MDKPNIKQIAETQKLADKLSQIGLSKRLEEIEKRLSALESKMKPSKDLDEIRQHCDSLGVPSLWYDRLIEIVLADRKKYELQAKISAWQTIKGCVENTSDNTERLLRFHLPRFDDILDELKQELESYEQ